MPKFMVEIHETQHWVYRYEVEAKSSEEAHHIAESLHFEGIEIYKSELYDSNITGTYCKEIENA